MKVEINFGKALDLLKETGKVIKANAKEFVKVVEVKKEEKTK